MTGSWTANGETRVSTSVGDGSHCSRHWHCRVTSGVNAGLEAVIGARPITVGADSSCDLVLSDPSVSRRHAEITIAAHGVAVRDLKSTNGTYYQASRIGEVVLSGDFSLTIGKTTLSVFSDSPQVVSPSRRTRFGGLIGQSVAMREVFSVLEMASPTDATVVVEGESGTGKELVARAIHDHSSRGAGPFVTVDCSALQQNLLDSHLFGHVSGAFTGASGSRRGAFVEADGGTLFLDEISELPLASQGKLLRVLEAGTVQPVGSDRKTVVDVRVVAASNRNLDAMVKEKVFRFDLFHRLAVVFIYTPPLRNHVEDIPLLVESFFEGRNVDAGPIEGENLRKLVGHGWPGNVRELRNVIERAWILSGSQNKRFADLVINFGPQTGGEDAANVDLSVPFKQAKEEWIALFERRYVAAVYAANGFNLSKAATQAGINRNHLRKLLIQHGLKKDE